MTEKQAAVMEKHKELFRRLLAVTLRGQCSVEWEEGYQVLADAPAQEAWRVRRETLEEAVCAVDGLQGVAAVQRRGRSDGK